MLLFVEWWALYGMQEQVLAGKEVGKEVGERLGLDLQQCYGPTLWGGVELGGQW